MVSVGGNFYTIGMCAFFFVLLLICIYRLLHSWLGATNVGLRPIRGLLVIVGFGDGSQGNEGNKFCS